jgi:anion-transporting  ArsA/GET3 family ATPase
MELPELAEEIVRVASGRRPDQNFTCHVMDRRDGSLPDLAESVAVLELLRWVRIVDDTAPTAAGIRLCEVPDPVRKNRRVGDPWYVVDAFILVEQ